MSVAATCVDDSTGSRSSSFCGRRWDFRRYDDAVAMAISQRFDIPDIVGRILAARGFTPQQAGAFLEPRLRELLPEPSHLLDLDKAVERLVDAIEVDEPVGILTDYDVDGATACGLLTRYLRSVGAQVAIDIPDRLAEGYGPNRQAFDRLAEQGCQLVVVLDAGTTAYEPLAYARDQGQEVIVVDHHVAEADLPAALAVINPNRVDQTGPLGEIAAVGVTFVLVVALNRILRQQGRFKNQAEPDLRQWLDLVALGTVCDLVSLTGLNRAFVAQGLKVAARGANPGLAALSSAIGLERMPSADHFGYMLGPRINAGGRTGHSSLGARLLVIEDRGEAEQIARQLDALNAERRRIEQEVLEAAERSLKQDLLAGSPVLVAAGENWSPGVVGIVASRLVERYHRPALVIGITNGVGKGSGRSIKGFDLGSAIIQARRQGMVSKGGGHPMAAGVTLSADQIEPLRALLVEQMTAALGPKAPAPPDLRIDAQLMVRALTPELHAALQRLGPFGRGNAEPRLLLPAVQFRQPRRIGETHLDGWISDQGGPQIRGVAFRVANQPLGTALLAQDGGLLDLVGKMKLDHWQGRARTCFQIEDAAPCSSRIYELADKAKVDLCRLHG